MSIDVKYRTTATTTGGRDGRAFIEGDPLDFKLVVPKELGGPGGEGTNPEQLFAAGYSACFLGALKRASRMQDVEISSDTSVSATVGIGANAQGGFGLTVDLVANLPGVDRSVAERLVEVAHHVCPYSNATRNNIDVTVSVA